MDVRTRQTADKKKILFVHNNSAKFILIDRDLLATEFDLTDYYFQILSKINLPDLWRRVNQTDCVFCWFASWHSVFPILFANMQHKKSILVIGGYDIANLPEIGYGHQRGGIKKWLSRWVINHASVLMTNSYYSQGEAEKNVGISKEKVRVFYHGVEDSFKGIRLEKENIALTVGNVDRPNLFRKGLEPFVRAAAFLPEIRFVVVGNWMDDAIAYLRSIATPNVLFTGWVSDEELVSYYQRASVYAQISQHEGFGMSLAEAMLAGCIPVVTRAGSLPEVVGDCGIVCDSTDPQSLANCMAKGLRSTNSERIRARERILTHFSLDQRKKGLHEIISGICA